MPLAAVLPDSVGFYIGLMILGFVIGGFGHLTRSKPVIALGIALIFAATVLLPVLLNFFEEAPPSPQIQSPSGE